VFRDNLTHLHLSGSFAVENLQVLIIDTNKHLYDTIEQFVAQYADRGKPTLRVQSDLEECHTEHDAQVLCFINIDSYNRENVLAFLSKRLQEKTLATAGLVVCGEVTSKDRSILHKQYGVNFTTSVANFDFDFLLNVFHSLIFHKSVESVLQLQSCVSIIGIICSMIEMKTTTNDKHHSHRVGEYSYLLALQLEYTVQQSALIRESAKLHDIGLIAVPEFILEKEGSWTTLEVACMQEHTIQGSHILSRYEDPLFQMAASIAENHHERFNGSGYPRGLESHDIPFEAKIVAIADVFDGMTRPQERKPAKSIEEALGFLIQNKGILFDGFLVDAFVLCQDKIQTVHDEILLNNTW
jgi:response regulator RpfG family c-di-GMP phosphodiesterase